MAITYFKVKTCNDAHVVLSSGVDVTDNVYEVVMGMGGGTSSAIRLVDMNPYEYVIAYEVILIFSLNRIYKQKEFLTLRQALRKKIYFIIIINLR